MADIPGDLSTTATLTVGGTATDTLESSGDHDWFKITLTAGQAVVITIDGITLVDPYLTIRDSAGNVLFTNDDIVDGVIRNSRVAFNPTYTGTYYIDVGAFQDKYAGSYQVSVQPYTAPPLATNDQIADQLVNGFWGGDAHHFNVTQGGTITVNISTLNSDEQVLARAALQEWADIIGVHFQEVTSGGQIQFDHSEGSDGLIAETDAIWANGIISSAHVHISSSWVQEFGSGLNSYSFQAYVHEIGHALGLGHSGNYNFDARFPYDATFLNDAWSTTIMSYFDQHQNTYFNNRGFTLNFAVTPMVADIIAMQELYGLSTTTRTGNTTYGYNSNAGTIYNASQYPGVAYTIFDSGGTDTLDYSGAVYNQIINLNPESFSSVAGNTGNLVIARGVAIENAIGGSADDTIIQNALNNVLNGGGGTDTLSYETSTAPVTINLGLTAAQDTGGAGTDTLTGFEKLIGSPFADVLVGGLLTISLDGGVGDDFIQAGPGSPTRNIGLYGGDGNDVFTLGDGIGAHWVDGGSGFNVLDCSSSTVAVQLTTGGHFGASADTLVNIQKVIGSNFDDHLWAWNSGDEVLGGAGNDILEGSPWGPSKLAGGTGNDTYLLWDGPAQITELAGEGVDTVDARGNCTLGANLENITLHEMVSSDPFAGASVPPSGGVSEDWSGTGNDIANLIIGNAGANALSGMGGDDILTGKAGADTLTGGAGADTFKDTAAGLSGDTIVDLTRLDKIVITDANIAGFTFSLSGNTLTYSGGSLTLAAVPGGEFVAAAAVGGGVELTVSQGPAPHDFNGDGYSDIILRNDSGLVTNWLGSANGALISNSAVFSVNPGTDWHVEGTGDFNGDGFGDVLWRNDSGAVVTFLGAPNGSFVGNVNFNLNPGTDWHVQGTGDFNGDGRDDILWRNDLGTVVTLLGNANGSFTGNVNFLLNPGLDWHVEGTGDFNGDSRDDILWRNDLGTVVTLLGNANGSFTGNVNFLLNPGLDWHIAGTGDFNGDGRDDILWRNDIGNVVDLLGNANGSFTGNVNFQLNPGLDWHIEGTGDFNGDGYDDILWRNDSGTMTDLLGQANGAFIGNVANFTANPGLDWHVQPEHSLF